MYGMRMRAMRKQRKLTLEEASEMLDLPRSTLGSYEKEDKKPSLDRLIAIARFYDTSLDYLLGLTDNQSPKNDEHDAEHFFNKENLTWHGVPLSDEELRPIRDILENMIRRRLPSDDGDDK